MPSPFFLQPGQFSHRIIELASFSSLHHAALEKRIPENISSGFLTFPEQTKEDDESFASGLKAFMEKSATADDIPGGTETGSMFHDILENISFESAAEADSTTRGKTHPLLATAQNRDLIESCMDMYQIDRRWINPICDVILNTLTTPVCELDPSFFLAQLKSVDRIHEAEFYFPYPLKEQKIIPEFKTCHGFIRGFIDLIFKYEDKFYIADWKSNILEEGYSRTSMEKSMTGANYHLQYKIYTIATMRWLKNKLGDLFNPEKNFGGVFYFYLRGMDGKSDKGIYHVPASKLFPMKKLENDLLIV